MERYNFKIVEDKWQKYWKENNIFKTKTDKNKKENSSGLIIPSYGESANLGFFLKEGGYYFTILFEVVVNNFFPKTLYISIFSIFAFAVIVISSPILAGLGYIT